MHNTLISPPGTAENVCPGEGCGQRIEAGIVGIPFLVKIRSLSSAKTGNADLLKELKKRYGKLPLSFPHLTIETTSTHKECAVYETLVGDIDLHTLYPDCLPAPSQYPFLCIASNTGACHF